MIDFASNHFQLFGLPATFRVDADVLEERYRALQRDVHPDRAGAAGASDADARLSLQRSAQVNEAYRTLRDPVERGRYLLAMQGVDALDETDTVLPIPFLEAQLERREAASNARHAGDVATLEDILGAIRRDARTREASLAERLDANDTGNARSDVRELKFLQKVAADVDAMIDALEP